MNSEQMRLNEADSGQGRWRKWGPYLSERQWGTVREDYSPDGNAWDYFPHEMARSRAYRWGEDGLAGFCDDQQSLCLSVALWNGRDPILKERLFGLTNHEGNHGEDVKECYDYLDATPTHSYLKMLYRYPQAAFPYAELVEENRRLGKDEGEYELADTGVFEEGSYFDVCVEYAKAAPDDILMRISVQNRADVEASIHVLPQAWFRNTWSWQGDADRPELRVENGHVVLEHARLGRLFLYADEFPDWLCCENETNRPKLWGQGEPGHYKDAFHECVINGREEAVNPDRRGTKAAAHYIRTLPAGGTTTSRLRLSPEPADAPFESFDEVFNARISEADAFYADIQQGIDEAEARRIQRLAFAGLIWTKQFYYYYYYYVAQWLDGDPAQPPPPPERRHVRNWQWRHLNNAEVLSMPDAWEYPWYASWDLAFHCIPLTLIDPEFAKNQLLLLHRVWYLHPSGQLPAYEWDFNEANPPVHAWAAWRVFQIDRKQRGDRGDLEFLERIFHKLMLNFTWWVNRKDVQGRNVFQGGFLGLDNIGVFDRSDPLPMGGHINQADGTNWMAMYCLNLMRIALELALHNRVYEDVATKFFEHFLYIAKAMTNIAETGLGLWDERDEFYYDVLNLPDGRVVPLRLRSMVGLIPLFAVETIEPEMLEKLPDFRRRLECFLANRPEMAALVSRWQEPGRGERRLLSLLRGHRMKCLIRRMLDPEEFLSDYGVRSLSRIYQSKPFELPCDGHSLTVSYEPGESESGVFGGNSNWRGPIWMPVNYLLIESLQKFHHYYYGDDFKIECPTGSGRFVTILDAADELTRRLIGLFLPDTQDRRPCMKGSAEPGWRTPGDRVVFHEHFHGETGRGLGASHQTGWTALIAKLLHPKRKPH